MKHEAIFDQDKENKKMTITRPFNASLPLVWDAWTKAEILDQWWAPEPYKTETKSMDFHEGGFWLYAMVGEGQKHWCRADYKKIKPKTNFTYIDAFCDENGKSTNFPNMHWLNEFAETNGTTTVTVNITFPTQEDMDKIMEMGFKEGFTAGLNNLEEYLAKKK
ncbi:MAG: SRPBCC domain-containing protein [Chitinophagaceae bacterium]|nr:SRPBCC domain-containing protein [Chitinophagaceae bacterium]